MLATDPAKAVSEVAHELMHAAHAGLIWPDEPLIGRALQLEVGMVTGVRFLVTVGADNRRWRTRRDILNNYIERGTICFWLAPQSRSLGAVSSVCLMVRHVTTS